MGRIHAVWIALPSILGAFVVGRFIVLGDYERVVFVAVFGLIGFVGLSILRNWRFGIITFFIWIVFEDLVRKYLGNNILVYWAKDVVILLTYFSYFWSTRNSPHAGLKNPLKVPLLLWFGWALVESFNPGIQNWLVPLVGLRMSFFYIPMLYLGYAFLDHERRLTKLATLALSLAAVVSVLGIIQAIVGLHFLNPEGVETLRLDLVRRAPETGLPVPRPTSVFVDAGRFAQYLFVVFFLGLGTLLYLYNRRSERGDRVGPSVLWLAACFLLLVVGLFVSGQRAAVLFVILASLFLALEYWRQTGFLVRRARSTASPLLRVMFTAGAGFVLLSALFPEQFEAVSSFYTETLLASITYRPAKYAEDLLRAIGESGLLGHGTGTASLGLQYVFNAPFGGWSGIYFVEGGYAGVAWEWGIVGLFLWLWWTVRLLSVSFRKVRALRGTPLYWFAFCIIVFTGFTLYPYFYLGMQMYQQYVVQAFLWFLAGILFKLPLLTKARLPRH